MEGDDVALAEQPVKRHIGERGIVGREGVVAKHLHPEPAADVDEATPDFACSHHADRLAVQIETDHVGQTEIEVARADIGYVNAADGGQKQRHGVFRNRVGRVGGNAQNRQFSACVPQIHIVEARATQEQNADAHVAEQVNDCRVYAVVDEHADRVAPARERRSVLGQLVLEKFETDLIRLAERFKRRAVVGLGIVKCNLHVCPPIVRSYSYYTPVS